jgi:FMN phosphatase YigB (HAD superfamily)
MYKALCFDLDNTLILYSEPAFLQQYFEKLAQTFADLYPSRIARGARDDVHHRTRLE